jgi:hypothetical protein
MITAIIEYIKDHQAVDWPNILKIREWPSHDLITIALASFMVYIMYPEWIADIIHSIVVSFFVLQDTDKAFLDNHYYPALKNAVIDVKTTPDFWKVYFILFGICMKLL